MHCALETFTLGDNWAGSQFREEGRLNWIWGESRAQGDGGGHRDHEEWLGLSLMLGNAP